MPSRFDFCEPETARDVVQMVRWWITRSRGRLSLVMRRAGPAGVAEFTNSVWLRLVESESSTMDRYRLSTLVAKACTWEMSRQKKRDRLRTEHATFPPVTYSDRYLGDEYDTKHIRHRIEDAMRHLPNRLQAVIHLRYGLFESPPHDRGEVAALMKCTCERIRQHEYKSLRLLAELLVDIEGLLVFHEPATPYLCRYVPTGYPFPFFGGDAMSRNRYFDDQGNPTHDGGPDIIDGADSDGWLEDQRDRADMLDELYDE